MRQLWRAQSGSLLGDDRTRIERHLDSDDHPVNDLAAVRRGNSGPVAQFEAKPGEHVGTIKRHLIDCDVSEHPRRSNQRSRMFLRATNCGQRAACDHVVIEQGFEEVCITATPGGEVLPYDHDRVHAQRMRALLSQCADMAQPSRLVARDRPDFRGMEEIDDSSSMPYVSPALTIRGTAPLNTDRFFAGEYRDVDDRFVGSYRVFSPTGERWHDEPTIAVTEVLDRDGALFMRILRRPRHVRSVLVGNNTCRGQYLVVDTEDFAVATLWPRFFLNGNRLRVRVDFGDNRGGELKEEPVRHEHGERIFDVQAFDPLSLVGTIRWRFPSKHTKRATGDDEPQHQDIHVQHEPGTTPAWRCTTLALATCLAQFGITSAVVSDGSPTTF